MSVIKIKGVLKYQGREQEKPTNRGEPYKKRLKKKKSAGISRTINLTVSLAA